MKIDIGKWKFYYTILNFAVHFSDITNPKAKNATKAQKHKIPRNNYFNLTHTVNFNVLVF